MISIVKFVLVMVLGYLLKKWRIVTKDGVKTLSPIMMYVTLPCAMAASTQFLVPNNSILILSVIAFAIDAFMLLLGRFISKNQEEQILFMVNLSSLNIGGFSVPFCQGILPNAATAFAGMYDVGNTWYGNGASYWIPKAMQDGGDGFHVTQIFRKLCRSAPLITYLVFLILAFLNIKLPDAFFQIVQEIGNCNFLVVFLIAGIAMDLRVSLREWKIVLKFMAVKYGGGILIAVLFYFFLPFDRMIRQTVILCVLAPQASTSIAYCELLDCDSRISSTMYTGSTISTLIIYFVLGKVWRV